MGVTSWNTARKAVGCTRLLDALGRMRQRHFDRASLSQENALKTRRVPLVECALCWGPGLLLERLFLQEFNDGLIKDLWH